MGTVTVHLNIYDLKLTYKSFEQACRLPGGTHVHHVTYYHEKKKE